MRRITLLFRAVLLPVVLWLSVADEASAAPIDVTVITQNLYLGVDPTPVLQNPTSQTINAAIQGVLANNFPLRASAIAGEAAAAGGPLLIGLQEAEIISGPNLRLDYAQILLGQLTASGLHYAIAGVHTGFQASLGGFSLTDQEVVLARTDVPGFAVTGSEAHTFVHDVVLPTALGPFPLQRGYVLVDATINGSPFEFVSTHLDETRSSAQLLETDEILARLSSTAEPQLVVGDFNARPGDLCGAAMVPCGPAEMLASGFTDAFAAAGTGPGLTCCQKPELDDPVSQLNRRFDYVFERGFSSVVSAFLVGDQPFETTRPVWPSDHAGVVATVALAPVPEPSAALLFVSAIFVTGVVGVRFRP